MPICVANFDRTEIPDKFAPLSPTSLFLFIGPLKCPLGK